MKRVFLILTICLSIFQNTHAFDLNAITLDTGSIKAKYVSIFLVTGRQNFAGSFIINRLYKKLGTFDSKNSIDIPAQDVPRDGWRRPSHMLVITHNQKELSPNKFNVMGLEGFTKPSFFNEKDFVAPTKANTQYIERRGILINILNNKDIWVL